jgi:hypothetical protein
LDAEMLDAGNGVSLADDEVHPRVVEHPFRMVALSNATAACRGGFA